jgi:endonuclease YncB( thermonuclease family)
MKNLRRLFFLVPLLLLTLAMPALAEEAATAAAAAAPEQKAEGLTLIDSGTVKEILKSDMILLDNDKRYRLDNIRVPTDYAQQALDELGAVLLNKKVNVYTTGDKDAGIDRYGVPLAQVMREDSVWIQDVMLSKGFAWADISGAGKKMLDVLRSMEADARAKKLGFWANPAYAVKTPDNVQNYTNSYQIVEGKVLYVTKKNNYTYINFGRDWKKDFTINMPKKTWRYFSSITSEGFDPSPWGGRLIRIRGWVEDKENGPTIELTDPQQIEFIKQ